MTTGHIFLLSALALFFYQSIWAIFAIKKERADLADVAWGGGFFFIAWLSFFLSGFSPFGLVVNILITLWALRLVFSIYKRHRSRKEDFRYQDLKKGWGVKTGLNTYFRVFIFQGVLLYLIALPILSIHVHPKELNWTSEWFGVFVWLIGFSIEAISDYQLAHFRLKSSGDKKLLTTGLWSYSRHPNYLGEIVMWWAIWILAADLPFAWALLISPLLITFIIVFVSGVRPLEKRMKEYPGFDAYAKKTPILVPLSFANAILYTLSWFLIIYFGARGSHFIALLFASFCFFGQLTLLYFKNKRAFLVGVILWVYPLILGFFIEMLFINSNLLSYPTKSHFPPLWLLSLYPLFSLTLNTSLAFINKRLFVAFLLGGVGAIFSYLSGEVMGGVIFLTPLAFPAIFSLWGLLLVLLVLINRKLGAITEKYMNPYEKVTVIFDKKCPICSREIASLKKRKETGKIEYLSPSSDQDLSKITKSFSYKQAMEKIHAINVNGEVLTGVDALSAMYARTNLPLVAILLQAPGFRPLFVFSYGVWARVRLLGR